MLDRSPASTRALPLGLLLAAWAVACTPTNNPAQIAQAMAAGQAQAREYRLAVEHEARGLVPLAAIFGLDEATSQFSPYDDAPRYTTTTTTGLYYHGTDSTGEPVDDYLADKYPIGDGLAHGDAPPFRWVRHQVDATAIRSLVAQGSSRKPSATPLFRVTILPLVAATTPMDLTEGEIALGAMWPAAGWLDPRTNRWIAPSPSPSPESASWADAIIAGGADVTLVTGAPPVGLSDVVLDVPVRAGRARIWVDPAHGYLVRQSEFYPDYGFAEGPLLWRQAMPEVQSVDVDGASLWLPHRVTRQTYLWGKTQHEVPQDLPPAWEEIVIRGTGQSVGILAVEDTVTYEPLTLADFQARRLTLAQAEPIAAEPGGWWTPAGAEVTDRRPAPTAD